MSFLNPAFFWALTAISIPIIIHLINFRRHKLLYFSNTKYLFNIKKETKNKTRLKQLLILLARILSIIMLVFVFSGPFIPFDKNKDIDSEPTAITGIYLDNSYSMQAEGKSGQLFALAKQTALEIVINSPSNMQYVYINNEIKPEHQNLLSREQAISEIEKTEITPFQIGMDDVILKASTIIESDVNSTIYLLSDMQKSFIKEPVANLGDNINLVFIPIVGQNANNIFIDTCFFETPVHRYGQHEKLIVRVRSFSNEDNYDIPLHLFINDSLKAFAGVNLEAGETKDIEINFLNTTHGHIDARLELTDYPIIYDNSIYFNYYIAEKIRVLGIGGQGENRFLNALYHSDEDNFDFQFVKQGTEQSMGFSAFDIIVLHDISDISSGLSDALKNFVNDGGTLSFIPSDELNHSSVNSFMNLFNAGLFSYEKAGSLRMAAPDYNHRLFEDVFQKHETQADFPVLASIHKFSPNTASAPEILMRTENNLPLLTKYSYGRGSLYIFTMPINNTNIDYVRHPVYVPVMYNMALNAQLNNPHYILLEQGSEFEIISYREIADNELIKITNKEDIEIIPEHRFAGNSLSVFLPEEITEAGNYKVYSGKKLISGLSVNYNRNESVSEYYNNENLNKLVNTKYGSSATVIESGKENYYQAIKELGSGQPLWQIFLLLALFFVICEILLIRFLR
jgi:hypothetical protein